MSKQHKFHYSEACLSNLFGSAVARRKYWNDSLSVTERRDDRLQLRVSNSCCHFRILTQP